MKPYLYYLILGMLPLVSCTDGLDLYPNDKITVDNYWKTADDVIRAVNGTYQFTFPEQDSYGCDLFFLETASDNSYPQHSNQFGNFQQIALNAFESDHPALLELWGRRYTCIRRCADVLANVDKVQMDEALKERCRSEVLFQRAYAYYYMITQWGDVPWVDHPLTNKEASSIKRTDKYAVAKQIIADLDYAASALPSSYTGTDDGRVSKWAAFALKSRICMFMAGDYRKPFDDQKWYWEQAKNATDSVILKSGKVLYTPGNQLTGESYRKLFYDNNASTGNGEIIYDAQFTNAERALYGFTVKVACISDGGWNSWTPTQSMIDAYEVKAGNSAYPISDPASGYDRNDPYKNRDPRLAASVYYSGPGGTTLAGTPFDSQPGSTSGDKMDQHNGTPTGYGWKKFVDPSAIGTWDTGRDYPLIRLAEVYLDAAEARNELASAPSSDPKIRNYSGMTRWRVGMPDFPNGLSKDDMRERIRNERRVEFAFEGTRFFDIRRWGIAEDVLNAHDGWIIGMKLTNNPGGYRVVVGGDWDGHVMVRQRTEFSGQQYIWPVPRQELDLNPNLAADPLLTIESK